MSSKLDTKTVEKVAQLARLKLSDSEIESLGQVLSDVLSNFEQIANVDTKDIRPLVTPTDISQTLRADISEVLVESDKLLDGAPEKSGRLYKVPPVV